MDALALNLQFLNHGGHIVTPSIERRAVTTSAPAKKTCGYYDGDPSRQRTAEEGFDCRVDVSRALWGFCTTTVISAGDCNFAGACFDRDACLEGCVASTTPSSVDDTSPASAPSQDSSTTLSPETTTQSGEAGNTTPNNNTGAIIGGVIGGLAMICLTIFAIVYLFRRGQRRRSEVKTQQQTPGPQEIEYITNSYHENKAPRYPVELHSTPRAPSYAPVELHG
ncbi:hypothetical protein PG993_000306 [Apiospora rasikravindrae]|uniref:Uncharacterized protein n=1 Tax=Apiospora rasikravindrae TaxID=990691 RepID=A0ABR1U869_9PEZI